MPKNLKQVNKYHYDCLQFGNQIIQDVRNKIPLGAGNQQFDQKSTNNAAQGRTDLAYKTQPLVRPKRMAATAIATGAGNCDQQGSLAYCLLREKLSNEYTVHLIMNPIDKHTYAGFAHNNAPTDIFIVDAWPDFSQTTHVDDSRFGAKQEWFVRSKPGKKDEGELQFQKPVYVDMSNHIEAELNALNSQFQTEGKAGPLAPWNCQFATRDPNVAFVGPGNEEVPKPHQRHIQAPVAPPSSLPITTSNNGSVMIDIAAYESSSSNASSSSSNNGGCAVM